MFRPPKSGTISSRPWPRLKDLERSVGLERGTHPDKAGPSLEILPPPQNVPPRDTRNSVYHKNPGVTFFSSRKWIQVSCRENNRFEPYDLLLEADEIRIEQSDAHLNHLLLVNYTTQLPAILKNIEIVVTRIYLQTICHSHHLNR